MPVLPRHLKLDFRRTFSLSCLEAKPSRLQLGTMVSYASGTVTHAVPCQMVANEVYACTPPHPYPTQTLTDANATLTLLCWLVGRRCWFGMKRHGLFDVMSGMDLLSMAQAADKFQEQMDSMARRMVRIQLHACTFVWLLLGNLMLQTDSPPRRVLKFLDTGTLGKKIRLWQLSP